MEAEGICTKECYLGPNMGLFTIGMKLLIDPSRPEAVWFKFDNPDAEKIRQTTKQNLEAQAKNHFEQGMEKRLNALTSQVEMAIGGIQKLQAERRTVAATTPDPALQSELNRLTKENAELKNRPSK